MLLSIIVPTLNEAAHIGAVLDSVVSQSTPWELLVVDGGSQDATTRIVRTFSSARLIHAPKCRATQMNVGAANARGDVLLFLHGDTRLPEGGLDAIRAAIREPGTVAGSFYLGFDDAAPVLALYSMFSRINLALFTYGDQAMFFRRQVFERLGGFKDLPFMEDLEIQGRVRRCGRFVKLNQPVLSSARRFRSVGIVRQQLLNIVLVLLYKLGARPAWLKRFYTDVDRDGAPGARGL